MKNDPIDNAQMLSMLEAKPELSEFVCSEFYSELDDNERLIYLLMLLKISSPIKYGEFMKTCNIEVPNGESLILK